jgi:hypothetical protein
MLYAMARAGAAPEAALAPLLAATKAQLPAFSGQQVANSLWALASLGRRDDELLALVARLMSAPHRPHASPQVCVWVCVWVGGCGCGWVCVGVCGCVWVCVGVCGCVGVLPRAGGHLRCCSNAALHVILPDAQPEQCWHLQ